MYSKALSFLAGLGLGAATIIALAEIHAAYRKRQSEAIGWGPVQGTPMADLERAKAQFEQMGTPLAESGPFIAPSKPVNIEGDLFADGGKEILKDIERKMKAYLDNPN